jgi:hypothetical protein
MGDIPLTVAEVEALRDSALENPQRRDMVIAQEANALVAALCDYWLGAMKAKAYPRITEPPAAPVPNQGWGGYPKPKPKAKARKRRSSKRLTK